MDGKFIKNEKFGKANHLTFEVFSDKALTLVPTGQYFKITDQGKRTLSQNAYMWKLLGEIAKKEDGHRGNDEEIYHRLLEMAGAKVEFLAILPEAVPKLRTTFPVVKIVDFMKSEKGKKMAVCKCYFGSSTFDNEEMSKLIDTLIDYCVSLEIPVDTEIFKRRKK